MNPKLMGRKSSAKSQAAPPAPPPGPGRSSSLATVAIVAAVVGVGAIVYMRQGKAEQQQPQPAAVVAVPAAQLEAHTQETLPPIDLPAYALQRPPDVIRAAYKFAAEHPEVLSYVPCFCGCEAAGHRGNHDCFVRERAVNGDVISWDDHGKECTVCIDVATRSRQLFEQGKSVADIRDAVEKDWAGKTTTHTPTPPAPKLN